jgi:hypothetical protein
MNAATQSPSFSGGNRFSEQTLEDLLGALRARAASHPDNPGLIAYWPAVHEKRMAAACTELVRLGHPVQRVSIAVWGSEKARNGWALDDRQGKAS